VREQSKASKGPPPRAANTQDSVESTKIKKEETKRPSSRKGGPEDTTEKVSSHLGSDEHSHHDVNQTTPLDQPEGWNQNLSYNYYKKLAQSSRVSSNQHQPVPVYDSSPGNAPSSKASNASTPVLVIPTPDQSRLMSTSRASKLSSMAVKKQSSRAEGTTESRVEAAKSREDRVGSKRVESHKKSSQEMITSHHKLPAITTAPRLSAREFPSSTGTASMVIPEALEDSYSSLATNGNIAKRSSSKRSTGERAGFESGINSLQNEPGSSNHGIASGLSSYDGGIMLQKRSSLRKKLLVQETAAGTRLERLEEPSPVPGEVGPRKVGSRGVELVGSKLELSGLDLTSTEVDPVKMPPIESLKLEDGAAFSSIISQYRSAGEVGGVEEESGNGSTAHLSVKMKESGQWPWLNN